MLLKQSEWVSIKLRFKSELNHLQIWQTLTDLKRLMTFISPRKKNRNNKKSKRKKRNKRSRKKRKNRRKRKINNIVIAIVIIHKKKMKKEIRKKNIKSVTDKRNNSVKGTDPDLRKDIKENVTHPLNQEAAILAE